jgi:hypothetical protein
MLALPLKSKSPEDLLTSLFRIKKGKNSDLFPDRLQLPAELGSIPLDMTAPDQTFTFFVGVEQLSGLEAIISFKPDVKDFVFPDVDFSHCEMPAMPRGNQPRIKTGIQGAHKRHLEGEACPEKSLRRIVQYVQRLASQRLPQQMSARLQRLARLSTRLLSSRRHTGRQETAIRVARHSSNGHVATRRIARPAHSAHERAKRRR